MRKLSLIAAALALTAPLAAPLSAGNTPASRIPGEIVAGASAADWTGIAPSDLLVMELTGDAHGRARRVVIQLMPAPFSQGWVGNIRKLAAAKFWDGTAVVRVQDNYVAQWGDPDAEDKAKARPLPEGLAVMTERDYVAASMPTAATKGRSKPQRMKAQGRYRSDPYGGAVFKSGWPLGNGKDTLWPVHCYGMVGVGRDMSPNTGTGAELYTVIGHAPRHLDRNIAVVGRVIDGMEHLSSLPRGTGPLGFYETPAERTGIVSVRLGGDVPGLPKYEYLSTESASFARYADARANRQDKFFIQPAGGADICNIPVPVRRVK